MIFRCQACGRVFSEEQAATKLRDWGYGTIEVYACPDCHDTAIVEEDEEEDYEL